MVLLLACFENDGEEKMRQIIVCHLCQDSTSMERLLQASGFRLHTFGSRGHIFRCVLMEESRILNQFSYIVTETVSYCSWLSYSPSIGQMAEWLWR
jgi:hypothetical protein